MRLLTAALLLALLGCDKSATITYQGTVRYAVDGAAEPSNPPGDNVPDPVTPPPVAGWDTGTNGSLLEGWNKRLDILGPADHVAIAPLGFTFDGQPHIEGFERQNSCYRWTAAIVAPADGEYEFTTKIKSGGSIEFDGELIWALDREEDATSFATGPPVPPFKRTLTKGKLYPIRATLIYQGLYHGLQIAWKRPDRELPESIATAFLRPPADWQSRLKEYQPPPPEPLPYTVPDAAYQSPELATRLFPAGSPWNTPIDQEPVDPLSDAIIARLGDIRLHPVFGQGGAGLPFEIVPAGTPKIAIPFTYSGESDAGPYPLPATPVVEGGAGDGHWLGVSLADNRLYELFLLRKEGGAWKADSGAIFDLTTGQRVPGWKPGWTSADAAGLPILPGLLRPDEVLVRKEVDHAIRVSVPATRAAFVAPASHFTHGSDPTRQATDLPPMGCRLRLKASVDEAAFPEGVRPIVRAMKRHGLVISDNGGGFIGLCGCPDRRWSDDTLAALKTITAKDFEVCRMGEVVTEVP